ncbi:uncharacterized protein LOC108161179 isoform X1 [Drosophila miranda]|uniref:uncharacterized protein LOC108161179 isoform X1 n=1 Tax=Drosophila miranda TaxID=7229 RepID=UPI00143F2D07|nr:uncharacterized protein LOC108161179 isoform X1 [Drosophila miranda]XP_033248618.1 uncharacterized protein LOC108161179 isoform X1 [Drosophila miranda]XP_033248619.1 uncharacterized protein LOC108161179 isoform X1 [Drosophila miranda]
MFGQHNLLAALFIIGSLIDFIMGLRLVEVRIPNYVIKGSAAQLECLYDLDGEALYSVKWYKDGNEFYRYVPRDMPPAQTFLLPGVKVDLHNSSDAIVTLRDVNLQSAGRFRCEVSGEAPSFQTVTEHGDMVVVSLPDQGPPKISGGRPRYQTGDWVRINCTAGRSKPAVDLSWFVNGEAVEPQKLRKYDSIVSGREGLETSVLGLQFRVEQKHFRNGDMKLKCVASLSTLYWRSNEESVEGDRPQKAPVLESRETVYASNSRADPVQGMSYRELFVTKILSLFIQTNAASKSDSLLLARAPSALLLVALAAVAALAGGGISVPQKSQSKNKDHQEDEKERKKERKHDKNLNERVSDVELSELLVSELLADFEEKSASQSSATRQQHRGVTVTAR